MVPNTGGGLVNTITQVGKKVGEVASEMPDWMKYSMYTTVGQGASGLASGYFQGESAEATLAQQQLLADREENQRQLLNRQGSYAPLIEFNQPGLAQTRTV